MALAVIGAGLPRTGTLSLKRALERLGFGPCHHMTEVFAAAGDWPLWERVADGDPVDWDEVFAGWRSAVDAPAVWFYRELAERYPKAKLILSERDPGRWFESMSATILSPEHRQGMDASPVGRIIRKLASRGTGWGEPGALGREGMIAMFRAHGEEVRRTIPAERLLVFQASEGWPPLCAFLGVPVPIEPYPRMNSPEEFHAIGTPP